jgi:hypothetical protein
VGLPREPKTWVKFMGKEKLRKSLQIEGLFKARHQGLSSFM